MHEVAIKSQIFEAGTEDQFQTLLQVQRRADRLPVILPTSDHVERMLQAAELAGFERDIVVGEVGPDMAVATIEKIAINAVMDGCQLKYMPIVIHAMSAICDSRLDVIEVQVTTHQFSPLLIINRPALQECGIASGSGALG